MVMTSDVQAALKQRFPIIMVDSVSSLESGKSIRTLKNVTTNELHGVGHFKGTTPAREHPTSRRRSSNEYPVAHHHRHAKFLN